ncbi:FAD/NAD(P)-binding domain-containing protein [Mollisia scopiformis]|uniref:FAD/NAD(P)-binding domain-containing protein n=1 Tax=Mollisia scopiformis TaxID=149040 RepID=A0A194XCA8_MOLSC|nr:FAD/NAD(P)-binding domain-containing protein [Mollisia scopiformis]KUJ17808.1 FAD/NAD(P)-binding domain-containing protein [Mollisia scopiformis]
MAAAGIAIIGGGPCGLTLARLLECKGIDYIVYERDESENSNRAGGSLDIHAGTGQHALREAGLLDGFKKYARYDDTAVTIADKQGKRLLQMGQNRDAPEIDRKDLRQILLDAIPKDKIKWGHTLLNAKIGEDKRPMLEFTNGVVLSKFKLVVGADGAWSKVRPMITPAIPQYSGKIFLESKVGHENPLYETTVSRVGPGMFLATGVGKSIVTQRQGDGTYRNYFGIQVEENFFRNGVLKLDVEATRRLLLSDFYADWAEEYQDLIRHATDLRVWSLYTLSTEDMNWKSVPGLTLVGDAAHLTIPNGEGVNLAMTDALKLASKIAEHGIEDVNRAVQEYENDMFPRGIATIAEGRRMEKVMFDEDPQAFFQALSDAAAQ